MTAITKSMFAVAAAGAAGSVALLLYVGHRNDSSILLLLFSIWVTSPFVALILTNMASKRWAASTRRALCGVILILALGSLTLYANAASIPAGSRHAFPFLVVPLGSWLLLITTIPLAALVSRRLCSMKPLRWMIKAVAMIAMSLVLAIVVLLGLLLLDHNQDTTLPEPTGSFAVGRTTCVWSDPGHLDPTAPRAGTHRELHAWIWYPASPKQPSQTFDEYLSVARRSAVERQRGVPITEFLTRDLSRVQSHSLRDADVSQQQPSYPVVIMRGGGAALVTDYSSLAEDLASHGYVVVGFDVPYRSWVVVLPDGRVIPRAPQNNLDLVGGAQADQLGIKLVTDWSADVGFALDQLERLNASDRFLGRLDMRRVGIFGHSLGGATALQFCHDDPRCKAGIDVDGAPVGVVVPEGISQPFMFLSSDHRSEPASETGPVEANIRSIYDRLPADRRVMLTMRGAGHYRFSDDGAMLKSPLLMRVLRSLGAVELDGRRQVVVTAYYISRFFNVHLKGLPGSELESNPEYPEIHPGV